MNKLIIIVILVFILGGGGYWYFGMHHARQYAEAVIPVYREWREEQYAILDKSSTIFEKREAYNYAGALAILQSLEEFLREERTKLLLLTPPFWGLEKQFHSDFLEFMDKNLEIVHGTKERANFLNKAQAYQDLFFVKMAPPAHTGEATINEIQARYEDAFPKAKTLGSELFTGEVISGLNDVSYSQVKAAWEDALSVFDILLAQVRALDLNDKKSLEIFMRSGQKLENFNQLLNEVIRLNSVYNLLSHTSAGDIPIFTGNGALSDTTAPEELVKLALKLHSDLWNLLKKYSYLSVGHNVDLPMFPQSSAVEQQ